MGKLVFKKLVIDDFTFSRSRCGIKSTQTVKGFRPRHRFREQKVILRALVRRKAAFMP
jgi:hypothetical protein